MRLSPRAEILDAIRSSLAPGERGAVAFDGDGTLWSGDVGEDFFHATVRRDDYRPEATAALKELARAHGLPDAGPGVVVAGGLYEAYLAGRFPEELVCEMMAWGVAGWTLAEVGLRVSPVGVAVTVTATVRLPVRPPASLAVTVRT